VTANVTANGRLRIVARPDHKVVAIEAKLSPLVRPTDGASSFSREPVEMLRRRALRC